MYYVSIVLAFLAVALTLILLISVQKKNRTAVEMFANASSKCAKEWKDVQLYTKNPDITYDGSRASVPFSAGVIINNTNVGGSFINHHTGGLYLAMCKIKDGGEPRTKTFFFAVPNGQSPIAINKNKEKSRKFYPISVFRANEVYDLKTASLKSIFKVDSDIVTVDMMTLRVPY